MSANVNEEVSENVSEDYASKHVLSPEHLGSERLEGLSERFAERLAALEVQLQRIETHCQSMTDHIKFVDRVYHVLQAPFQMLLNIWSFTHSALPLQTSLKVVPTAENLLHV